MTTFGRLLVSFVVIVILAIAALVYLFTHNSSSVPAGGASSTATTTVQTYGMSEYTDSSNGFTFWYPSSLIVSTSSPDSATNFPGGIDVERLDVGTQGGVYISVVDSASSTITDEPDGHAAPIAQTKYFYDASNGPSGEWMVAYPEGEDTGGPGATTTADISKTTVAGLPMLASGARFDTTIIPLSTTEFLVIQDGGASSFTPELAATVAPISAPADPSALSNALQAESAAYANQ